MMSNLNRSCSSRSVPLLAVVAAAAVLFTLHHAVVVDCAEVQWQILTKSNYTSQIRLHPHLLLLVTVPWSGESRSLMKELAHVVASDQVKYGTLKLMVLYRNVERMLADALGATDGITFIYHHNGFSYKYSGKLRVKNILSSVNYVMSHLPDELPLKSITSSDELRDFLDSTDKAVLLFEFCGWTRRLLAMNSNMTENGLDFSGEINGTLATEEKNNRKVDGCGPMGDDKLSCGIDNEFSGLSWPSHFTSVNDSFMKEAENLTFEAGASCTLDELSHFELFLQKVIPVAKEFFLPPERHRFALVRERSLLSLLNVEEPGSWSLAVSFAACPGCLKVLREGDDLRTVLQTQVSPVLELEDDLHGGEATLPAKQPTALLFVDRSSDSLQIKRESQRALNVFRELAQLYAMENQIRGLSSRPEKKTSTETSLASRSTLRHLRLQSFPASKKFILKDKMSIMIMNEGQQITVENMVPDFQGSSVHEILSYALNRKKELKLSSLAKDAGFQLLSKDFDVEVVDSLPPHSEVKSTQFIGDRLVEGDFKSSVDLNENEMVPVSSGGQSEELPDPSDAEHILLEGKEDSLDKSSKSNLESEHGMGVATDNTQGWNEAIRLSGIDENEQNKYFRGSFFFFDGQYRLLETLTGGLKMPSVVIIDPISQQHYVSDEQSVFNFSLLSVFVNSFLTGKLFPHQQSAPAVHSPIGALKPPFVNLDFHEKNSIPLVTVHSFAKLIIGNKSDSKNSRDPWDRNVLVLFSNSWCGFCQRMELVVREVYRAIKGCAKMKRNSSWRENLTSTSEYVEDIALKLPLIYMMDCTQNDCSLIIKPTLQRELYPLLLLFPAERKDNILVYEGDITVSDIIKFLADHGSHVLDLIMDKSFVQDQNSANEDPKRRNLHHAVLLKDRLQSETVKYDQMTSQFPVSSLELFAGCFLIATEKLLDVHPFDESKILILRVDQGTGFQGLIINKHISWDSLEEIEEGFELLKDAPLSFGGPVMRRGMPLVALTQKYIEGQSQEVLPNIYFVDHLATRSLLEEIRAGNQSVHDYWFFLGYSSWGWDQLFLEIAQGAWNVSQDNSEHWIGRWLAHE